MRLSKKDKELLRNLDEETIELDKDECYELNELGDIIGVLYTVVDGEVKSFTTYPSFSNVTELEVVIKYVNETIKHLQSRLRDFKRVRKIELKKQHYPGNSQ